MQNEKYFFFEKKIHSIKAEKIKKAETTMKYIFK